MEKHFLLLLLREKTERTDPVLPPLHTWDTHWAPEGIVWQGMRSPEPAEQNSLCQFNKPQQGLANCVVQQDPSNPNLIHSGIIFWTPRPSFIIRCLEIVVFPSLPWAPSPQREFSPVSRIKPCIHPPLLKEKPSEWAIVPLFSEEQRLCHFFNKLKLEGRGNGLF